VFGLNTQPLTLDDRDGSPNQLGANTYVYENHFCVVTIPFSLEDKLSALFIGSKKGVLRAATVSMSLKNAPWSFKEHGHVHLTSEADTGT
jgi:hypothetical protein